VKGKHPDGAAEADPPARVPAARRLALGTAQFGFAYGITNAAGKVPADQAHRILDVAERAGIDLIDTAYLYGESESVVGSWLRRNHAMKVVTKTPKFTDLSDPAAAAQRLHGSFRDSLARLGQQTIYGLLVHDADDLLAPAGEVLWSTMERLQRSGLVAKLGASVYTAQQITALVRRYPLQLMQLPLNAVDGRLKRREILDALAARKIEIHARSAFLQGLLLAPPETLGPHFAALKDALTRMARDCASHGLTRIDGALAAVLAHLEIDRVIVGVTSRNELREIVKAAGRAGHAAESLNLRSWEIDDEGILNPATWPMQRPS
jgi:aryl-alcohol dehydrogenase-like predicted oxidoreductase